MNDFESKDSRVFLGCYHSFHYSCILTWNLQSSDTNHRSCPLCREHVGTDVEDTITQNFSRFRQEMSYEASRFLPIERRPLGDVVNLEQGLTITCNSCHSHTLESCETCGIMVCDCQFTPNNQAWQARRFHAPRNPFTPSEDDLEEGEIPYVHCANCFVNREALVLDYMMDDHGDGDIFYHNHIQELFEHFFDDKSGRDNTEIYASYPIMTFEHFRSEIERVFQMEMEHRHTYDYNDDDNNEPPIENNQNDNTESDEIRRMVVFMPDVSVDDDDTELADPDSHREESREESRELEISQTEIIRNYIESLENRPDIDRFESEISLLHQMITNLFEPTPEAEPEQSVEVPEIIVIEEDEERPNVPSPHFCEDRSGADNNTIGLPEENARFLTPFLLGLYRRNNTVTGTGRDHQIRAERYFSIRQ